jgi:hypothetical protein
MPPSNQYPAPGPTPTPGPLPPQQTPPQQQTDQTPYDFFMEDGSQKRSGFSMGPSKKILFLVLAGAALIFLIIIIVIIISSSNKKPVPLSGVVLHQQEIIRVATDGTKNAKSDTLQNFAISAVVTMTSAQQTDLALLGKKGVKTNEKVLKASADAQTDRALAASITSNTYDATFSSVMKTELDEYDSSLDAALAGATSQQELKILQKQADGVDLLLKQLATP